MFTGIVTQVGSVVSRSKSAEQNAVELVLQSGYSDLIIGESVAVNGVCLTVTKIDLNSAGSVATFFVGYETLKRSNLGGLEVGTFCNLERATRLSDRLSGHIVQGHVDATAKVTQLAAHATSGGAFKLVFQLERESSYTINKGSIAVNGVSLTIVSVNGREVEIMIIPHTWYHTNFQYLTVGQLINIEFDMFAKYVERILQHQMSF